jgi:hypothetical protein
MSPLDQTLAFLRLLAGDQPQGRYLEIRSRIPSGMRQEFFAATRLDALHRRALWLGQRTDTYIGVVLRDTRSGKKEAVSRSHLIWCEIDSADAGDRLAGAGLKPAATVLSGIIFSRRTEVRTNAGDVCWRRVADTVRGWRPR